MNFLQVTAVECDSQGKIPDPLATTTFWVHKNQIKCVLNDGTVYVIAAPLQMGGTYYTTLKLVGVVDMANE